MVPPSEKSRLLLQLIDFISCSFFPIFCLGCISASLCFPWACRTTSQMKTNGELELQLGPREASSHCLPTPDVSQTSSQATEVFFLSFFFFLTTSKILSPWFSKSYPFLSFTLNHRGGKGIAEVRKYGKNANNLPLKYTLRIFSASIISTLNF